MSDAEATLNEIIEAIKAWQGRENADGPDALDTVVEIEFILKNNDLL